MYVAMSLESAEPSDVRHLSYVGDNKITLNVNDRRKIMIGKSGDKSAYEPSDPSGWCLSIVSK